MLSGFADYSVWYDITENQKSLATNLLLIEAKRRGNSEIALPQLAAYMGIVHATRKADKKYNKVVYGVACDGSCFIFCRIDNTGAFTMSEPLFWAWRAKKIYSILRAVLHAAALSSPSTTPVTNPLRRKIILDMFHDPKLAQNFDCGAQRDEDDDAMVDYEDLED